MRLALFWVGAACALLSACGDDPFLLRWTENPREAVLFALDREELNTVSAFDMRVGIGVVIEDPSTEGRWDFAVERQSGQMVLLPPQVLGVLSRAAIVPLAGTQFAEVMRAPFDTLVYIDDEAIPVDLGTIYVVRTHRQPGSFGEGCVYYGKLQPLEVDFEAGTLRFLHDTSPDCNNRSLVPPN